MTNGESEKGSQGSFEEAKAQLEAAAPPEGTTWDKPAPTAPPNQAQRRYKSWFLPVVSFFEKLAADEGLLADICLDKAIEIVQFQRNRRLVGIDAFVGDGGGAPGGDTTGVVAISVPIAVELYKQCLQGVIAREEEFKSAMLESAKLREMEERTRIVTPSGT